MEIKRSEAVPLRAGVLITGVLIIGSLLWDERQEGDPSIPAAGTDLFGHEMGGVENTQQIEYVAS